MILAQKHFVSEQHQNLNLRLVSSLFCFTGGDAVRILTHGDVKPSSAAVVLILLVLRPFSGSSCCEPLITFCHHYFMTVFVVTAMNCNVNICIFQCSQVTPVKGLCDPQRENHCSVGQAGWVKYQGKLIVLDWKEFL